MLSLLVVLMLQASAPGVYRVGDGVSAPRLVDKTEPEYSELARKAKIQGTAVLSHRSPKTMKEFVTPHGGSS